MVVDYAIGLVVTPAVAPKIDRHGFEVTIRPKSANTYGSALAILSSMLVEKSAKALPVRACKAQSRKHLTAFVGDFPNLVN